MDQLKFSGPGLGMLDARYVNVTGDTMTGALTLANLANALNSGNYAVQMKSGVADGASAVGYSFDTTNDLLTAGAKLFSFLNVGTEYAMLGLGRASFGSGNTNTLGYAFGSGNIVNGTDSFVAGSSNTVIGNGGIAIGIGSSAVDYGIALGFGSIVTDTNGSIALAGATASGYASFSHGPDNITTGFYGFTMGGYSTYNDGYICHSIGIQNSVDVNSSFSNVIGDVNYLLGAEHSTIIGSACTVDTSYGSVVLGMESLVEGGASGISIGYQCRVTSNYSTAIGYNSNAGGSYGIALGAFASANGGLYSVVVGGSSFGNNHLHTSNTYGVALGFGDSYAAFYSEKEKYSSIVTPRLAIGDIATTLGAELLTNSGMTADTNWTKGTGWTHGAGGFSHAAGTASTLTQTVTGLVVGQVYRISYVLGALSAGILRVSLATSATVFNNRDYRAGYTINNSPNGIKILFTATSTSEVITFSALSPTVCTIRSCSLKACLAGDISIAGKTYTNGGQVLGAGSTTILPQQFTSGALLTTALAGGFEFLTDDFYATITTGAARKGIVLNDGVNLTATRVPFATTNGRLTDSSLMTFDGTRLSPNFITLAGSSTTHSAMHFNDTGVLKTNPQPGDMEYSAGHWYVTNEARHAINTSGGIKTTTATIVNTVTETVLYTYTFAAGELHTDEYIKFALTGVISNASASDDYTLRIKFGGTTLHTITRVGGNVTNAGWDLDYSGTIRTDGASGTFVDHTKWSEGSMMDSQGETGTHAVDTTASQTFEVTVQWAAAKAGNTFSCTQGVLLFNH